MLRMSPPLGDLLRLGDDEAENRALLVKRAAVMDVDTVSVKAFPDVARRGDPRGQRLAGRQRSSHRRGYPVLPGKASRLSRSRTPRRSLLQATRSRCTYRRHARRAVCGLRLGQGVRLGFTRYLVRGDVEGARGGGRGDGRGRGAGRNRHSGAPRSTSRRSSRWSAARTYSIRSRRPG